MKPDEMLQQIVSGQSTALAQGITLLESQKASDWKLAKHLLNSLPPIKKNTKRVGFSGPPGVGKSTFIEKLGLQLIEEGDRVAVLAVDPSSEISGGSILGDKTRMEQLSRNANAFVRPSPTRGHLGGVTSRLPGVILLCEAAGYDWVVIESVGVGQSEVELSRMVDYFTLISQPGAGDELQGIKKGILEYVDLIVVNKKDRDPQLVNIAKQQYLAALKIVRGQDIGVLGVSALTGEGVAEVVTCLKDLFKKNNFEKRKEVSLFWFESLLQSEFRKLLHSDSRVGKVFKMQMDQIRQGQISPIDGVDQFLEELNISPAETKV